MGSGLDAAPFVPRLLQMRPSDAPRQWSAEATMVLIDISGFTSLSEQLARRGREGAEELVSTLTRIFTLLMSASDDDGDVVKFAGDALLVMYDGPDHALHACHAAASMQRLLRVVGGVRLAGARARLRMSVGVHTGEFMFMLSGADQQNLVVCGQPLDQLLELQDRALAGQTLVSRQVAAHLPRSARGAQSDLGILLERMPPVASIAPLGRRGGGPGDVTRFLPAPFQSRPDLLSSDSDHRRAAMAFAQVTGLNSLLATGAAFDRIDALTAIVERACGETGVVLLDTDVARDGYRYLLTAGAPQGVEDPEGRLLRALLRITAEGGESVRAGAASGRLFAGSVGAPFRKTYAVMGDTTNTAARLTARTGPGQVLAQVGMLARAHSAFETLPHPPLMVKGKSEPIPVAVVTALAGRRTRSDDARFVGRNDELTQLRSAFAHAQDGRGSLTEIVGEPGIGKSRLVAEALRDSPLTVHTVHTEPYGVEVAYGTLTALIRPMLGLSAVDDAAMTRNRLIDAVREHAPDLQAWLPLLAPALGTSAPSTPQVEELAPQFRPARLRAVLGTLLEALLPDPTIILIEDAHWVDQTSADALAGVFAEVGAQPWAVVLTRRDTTTGLRGSDQLPTLEMRPVAMPADEARDLVGRVSGGTLLPADLDSIVARGDGNPFFLVQLASASAQDAALPDSVEELVTARVDALDVTDRDTLRQAAVLGSVFSTDLYAAAVGSNDTAEFAGLTDFIEARPDGTLAFRRAIYRDVAYQQLTFRRRRELHHRAASAIERAPALAAAARLAMLSLHHHAAGRWPEAFRWSREAAFEARDHYANDEAVVFCRRAIESGRRAGTSVHELGAVRLVLGDVLSLAGRHEDAVAAFAAARTGARDPAELVALAYKIGMVRREEGRFGAALRAAARVRAHASELPTDERNTWVAEADLLSAGVRYWQGRSAECKRLTADVARTAQALPEGRDRTRLMARAYALHDSAVVELDGRAGAYGEQPIEMFKEIGDLYNEGRFSVNVAIGYYYEGRWDRAIEMYRRSLELAQRTGDVFSVAVAQMNIGELLAYQGKCGPARALLSESVATLQALNTPLAAAHAACFLGVAARLAGDLGAARASLDDSEALFARAGRNSGFSLDELATRRLELEVDAHSAEALETGRSLLAERADQLAPVHRARIHRCLALVLAAADRMSDSAEEFGQSLRACEGMASPYERALTMLAMTVRANADDHVRAEATDILTSLGATEMGRR